MGSPLTTIVLDLVSASFKGVQSLSYTVDQLNVDMFCLNFENGGLISVKKPEESSLLVEALHFPFQIA
jgi:hypothetical protein